MDSDEELEGEAFFHGEADDSTAASASPWLGPVLGATNGHDIISEADECVVQIGYRFRHQLSAPPVLVQQVPSKGLSYQLWPAADAMCWLLDELWGGHAPVESRHLAARQLPPPGEPPCGALRPAAVCSPVTSVPPGGCPQELTGGLAPCHMCAGALQPRQERQLSARSRPAMALEDVRLRLGSLRGRRVLELGSGTGLGGIVAASLGADVTLTDLPPVLGNLEANLDLNQGGVRAAGGSLAAAALPWGDAAAIADVAAAGRPFDLIIASDVVYYSYLFGPLLQTLRQLLQPPPPSPGCCQVSPSSGPGEGGTTPSPFILLAHVRRWKRDSKFFKKAARHFQVSAIRASPPFSQEARKGVHLYLFEHR